MRLPCCKNGTWRTTLWQSIDQMISLQLLDSNGKKTRFLPELKIELGIHNVTVANDRVETYARQGEYSYVIPPDFASLQNIIHWTLPLTGADIMQIEPLSMPDIQAAHYVVVMVGKE